MPRGSSTERGAARTLFCLCAFACVLLRVGVACALHGSKPKYARFFCRRSPPPSPPPLGPARPAEELERGPLENASGGCQVAALPAIRGLRRRSRAPWRQRGAAAVMHITVQKPSKKGDTKECKFVANDAMTVEQLKDLIAVECEWRPSCQRTARPRLPIGAVWARGAASCQPSWGGWAARGARAKSARRLPLTGDQTGRAPPSPPPGSQSRCRLTRRPSSLPTPSGRRATRRVTRSCA